MFYIKTFESFNKYPEIPEIVYHGQPPSYDKEQNYKRVEPVKFDKFDSKFKRFLKDENYGFYFTPTKKEAIEYAEGGNIYMCKLNIKNPYYYENIFNYNNEGLIKSATFITKSDYDKLIAHGYDSVVLLTFMDKIGEIVALYPEQIEILEILN